MNDFLPVKGELKRRPVAREDHCEACGEPGENLYHVAFKCSFAIRFWEAAKKAIGCQVPELHPATWTRDLLAGDRCSEKDMAIIICGAWSLWSGRNARRHGKEVWNPRVALKHVATMVEELMCLNMGGLKQPPREKQKWQKPVFGWRKVNTDASFQASSASGAGGAVVRDEEGRLLAAAAKRYAHLDDHYKKCGDL